MSSVELGAKSTLNGENNKWDCFGGLRNQMIGKFLLGYVLDITLR